MTEKEFQNKYSPKYDEITINGVTISYDCYGINVKDGKDVVCFYNEGGYCFMCSIPLEDVDLINRQQAEIENLKDILYDAEGVNLVNYWYQQCEIAENGCRNLEENNKKLQTEIEKLKKSVEIHKGIAEDWKYEAKKLKEMVGDDE